MVMIDVTGVKRYVSASGGVSTSISKAEITSSQLMRDLANAVEKKDELEESIENMKKMLHSALYSNA